jgi:hypothetical protein
MPIDTAEIVARPDRSYPASVPHATMPDTPKDWRFPMHCPQCGKGAAIPEQVESSTAELLAIRVRCKGCGHDWRLESQNPPVILKPKTDRRLKRSKESP